MRKLFQKIIPTKIVTVKKIIKNKTKAKEIVIKKINLDYDAIFKDIFYKSMKDCDDKQDSYNWAKNVFANRFKGKEIIPPTLKIIKEDKLLLKNNTMIEQNDIVTKFKKKKFVSNENYSVPNLERMNLGDNFGYRSKKNRLSLPCQCSGCLFGGFSKISTVIILKQKIHYCLVDLMINTVTLKFHSHGQIGIIQREDKE